RVWALLMTRIDDPKSLLCRDPRARGLDHPLRFRFAFGRISLENLRVAEREHQRDPAHSRRALEPDVGCRSRPPRRLKKNRYVAHARKLRGKPQKINSCNFSGFESV